ncbi:hypothetical protein A2572_02060 [Candidatus Collierbacteria bacterium RIFOXYD1_FULL_40_9]|uniref:Uncharacterized protein n=1 Tax=Candidatus Collierbacteria bacterium RIFOXYD1_FULL_40_9 TaxID=1817731 RepID=A0A1F5FTB3_9BACT|nr:MAG: hypothetical protein A2572_02060 [Candidatus Collierbacteria bacterium RIFOXYD1_FULL_40_9]
MGCAAVLVILLVTSLVGESVFCGLGQLQSFSSEQAGFLQRPDSLSHFKPVEQLSSELHLLLQPTIVGSGVDIGQTQLFSVEHSEFLHLLDSLSQKRPETQSLSSVQFSLQLTIVGVVVTVKVADGVAVIVAVGVAVGETVIVTVGGIVTGVVTVVTTVVSSVSLVSLTTVPFEPIHPTPCLQVVPEAQFVQCVL